MWFKKIRFKSNKSDFFKIMIFSKPYRRRRRTAQSYSPGGANVPSHVGTVGATWRIRLNLCFLRSTRVHNPNSKSTRSSVLAQLTAKYTYSGLFFPQNYPLPRGIWTPSNTWFPGPTRLPNPNGMSIGSAVFAGLTSVTDRQTDS